MDDGARVTMTDPQIHAARQTLKHNISGKWKCQKTAYILIPFFVKLSNKKKFHNVLFMLTYMSAKAKTRTEKKEVQNTIYKI